MTIEESEEHLCISNVLLVIMVDEIESGKHIKERISVVSE